MISHRSRARRRGALTRHVARTRQGYTLIELMVAVMVFTIGVLATMGSAAAVMSMMAGSQRRTVASTVVEARFERLRAESCLGHKAGSAVTRGVEERWQIVPLVQADDVTVVVSYPGSRGRMVNQTFRTYVSC